MDKQKAMQELGIPEELLIELISEFIKQADETLPQLRSWIDAQDWDGAAKSAHFIKGSAGNLRITDLYEIAKAMEMEAKGEKDLVRMQDALGRYQIAFAAFKKEMGL